MSIYKTCMQDAKQEEESEFTNFKYCCMLWMLFFSKLEKKKITL